MAFIEIPVRSVIGEPEEPAGGEQYCIVMPDGERIVYGDQYWVASGRAIVDGHPTGRLEKRQVTVTYGAWEHASSPTGGA